MLTIIFPNIDPVLITVGPLSVRWYGVAYAIGIIIAFYVMQKLSVYRERKYQSAKKNLQYFKKLTSSQFDTLSIYTLIGIVVGGRLGYVLFYYPEWFIERPLHVMNTLEGGMSFHGGFIGVIIALVIFCRRNNIAFLSLADLVCCTAPIGLFFGRCANFINAELYGRVTDVPWAIIFPNSDMLPRHPSQLYEAFFEGILLFVILITLFLKTRLSQKPGMISGLFILGYSLARIAMERYREPTVENINISILSITRGQFLTIPMIVCAITLMMYSSKKFKKINE